MIFFFYRVRRDKLGVLSIDYLFEQGCVDRTLDGGKKEANFFITHSISHSLKVSIFSWFHDFILEIVENFTFFVKQEIEFCYFPASESQVQRSLGLVLIYLELIMILNHKFNREFVNKLK